MSWRLHSAGVALGLAAAFAAPARADDAQSLRDEVQAALAERIRMERSELQGRIDALTAMETPTRAVRPTVARKSAGRAAKKLPAGRRGKVDAKYRGPDGQLWSGRGRPPRWVVAVEAAGEKREAYLIG